MGWGRAGAGCLTPLLRAGPDCGRSSTPSQRLGTSGRPAGDAARRLSAGLQAWEELAPLAPGPVGLSLPREQRELTRAQGLPFP